VIAIAIFVFVGVVTLPLVIAWAALEVAADGKDVDE